MNALHTGGHGCSCPETKEIEEDFVRLMDDWSAKLLLPCVGESGSWLMRLETWPEYIWVYQTWQELTHLKFTLQCEPEGDMVRVNWKCISGRW